MAAPRPPDVRELPEYAADPPVADTATARATAPHIARHLRSAAGPRDVFGVSFHPSSIRLAIFSQRIDYY